MHQGFGSPFETSLGLALVAICCLGPSCREEQAPPLKDPTEILEWATEAQFGDELAHDVVVAAVNGQEITVGDLAICRVVYPMRALAECLDDLVDTILVLDEATDDDRLDPRVDDARVAALASAFIRDAIDRPLGDESVTEAQIDAFRAEPVNRLYFERPELRQVSHMLIRSRSPDGPDDELRALAERVWAETDWTQVTSALDLDRVRRQWLDEAGDIGSAILVERHHLVRADNQNPADWPMMMPFVQEFADGVYAIAEPNQVYGPVETSFGEHFILLERIYPAVRLPADEAQSLARAEIGQRRRTEALGTTREALRARRNIIKREDIEVFRTDDEQLIRERSSEIRESLRPE